MTESQPVAIQRTLIRQSDSGTRAQASHITCWHTPLFYSRNDRVGLVQATTHLIGMALAEKKKWIWMLKWLLAEGVV